jgi:NADH-quinone oxidoreductase subunit J
MIIEDVLFSVFSALACLSGIMVISVTNPIQSVLFLVLVFFNASGLLILLHAEFFAMIFLVVYVGAIAVLFLFVVMMLNIKMVELQENLMRFLPLGGVMGLIFLFELLSVLGGSVKFHSTIDSSSYEYVSWVDALLKISNIESLGVVLYTYYYHLFLLSGLILFVAMVGAIILTMLHKSGVRRQNIIDQLARDCYATVVLKK